VSPVRGTRSPNPSCFFKGRRVGGGGCHQWANASPSSEEVQCLGPGDGGQVAASQQPGGRQSSKEVPNPKLIVIDSSDESFFGQLWRVLRPNSARVR
jgi:hypothetical protein